MLQMECMSEAKTKADHIFVEGWNAILRSRENRHGVSERCDFLLVMEPWGTKPEDVSVARLAIAVRSGRDLNRQIQQMTRTQTLAKISDVAQGLVEREWRLTHIATGVTESFSILVDVLGLDPDAESRTKRLTPLCLACNRLSCDASFIPWIVDRYKVDIEHVGLDELDRESRPLGFACRAGHAEASRALLRLGADPGAEVPSPMSMVLDQPDMLETMLTFVPADEALCDGFTPLMAAIDAQDETAVNILLKYGASVRTRTSWGLSPLYLACLRAPRLAILLMTNHPKIDVTVALASSEKTMPKMGDSDRKRDCFTSNTGIRIPGATPLHAVCLGSNDWSFRLDTAGMLLARGADPNAISIHRQTPLHFISPSLANPHSTRLIEMLLHHGASTCKTTVNGQTPIHYACLNYRLDWLKVMLPVSESEECINQPDRYGKTPISYTTRWAGTSRPIAVVKWLLAFGARRPRDPPFSPLWDQRSRNEYVRTATWTRLRHLVELGQVHRIASLMPTCSRNEILDAMKECRSKKILDMFHRRLQPYGPDTTENRSERDVELVRALTIAVPLTPGSVQLVVAHALT